MEPALSRTVATVKAALNLEQDVVRELIALGTVDKVWAWVDELDEAEREVVRKWMKRRPGQRHLPGKHNQKLHGRPGGRSEYVAGEWDRIEGHDALVNDSMDQMQAAMGDDWNDNADAFFRPRMEETVGDGIMLKNGEFRISSGNRDDLPHLERTAAQVDRLHDTVPVKKATIIIVDGHGSNRGGTTNGDHVSLNRDVFTSPKTSSHLMSSRPSAEYVISHEYGHVAHAAGVPAARMTTKYAEYKNTRRDVHIDPTNGISQYARVDSKEMFAEMFANFAMSGGTTKNKPTQDYASTFGWKAPA